MPPDSVQPASSVVGVVLVASACKNVVGHGQSSSWEFNALDFDKIGERPAPTDLDDNEDFQLSHAENSERFEPPMSDHAIDTAIRQRIPEKTRRTALGCERVSL